MTKCDQRGYYEFDEGPDMIPDSNDAKTTDKQIPPHILLDYFITRSSLKNLNIIFFTKWPLMMCVDI